MTNGSDLAGGGIAILFTCLCVVVILGVHVAISYWIYRDAKKRDNPNAVIWAILNLVSDPLGLILYLVIGRNQTSSLGGPPPVVGPPPDAPPPANTTRF